MNLFWVTRSLTNNREDHLTEFFAAALELSPSMRDRYAGVVLSEFARTNGWSEPMIASIETQPVYGGTTCRPDMRLTLMDGRNILCEHKLDALETAGPESERRDQLERYLALPADGIVYVRSSWKPPAPEVIAHPKYIRPQKREHFLWRDFYHLLDADGSLFLRWLKEGFERLGFTPPHPSIGEMSGPDNETNQINRRNFAKLWQRTCSIANSLGWKVSTGSIVELYLQSNSASLASSIFISPTKFDRFLFRVTPQLNSFNAAKECLQHILDELPKRTELITHEVTRKEGKQKVLDVTTSLQEILDAGPLVPEEIEAQLLSFTEPLLRALQK